MNIFRGVKLSWGALWAHKVRTFLALLGITIGVSAVIIMTAVGSGAKQEVMRRIGKMGTNLLVVSAGKTDNFAGRERRMGDLTTLKLSDYEAIRRSCPSIALASPVQDQSLRLKYGTWATDTTVLGVGPEFKEIRAFPMAYGRFFSQEENRASLRKAVLGSEAAAHLVPAGDPTGEFIRINNIPFEIIGVLRPRGAGAEGSNEDDQVFIPIKTAMRRVFNLDYIKNVFVQVREQGLMDTAETEIRTLLRDRHRLSSHDKADDFTILNMRKVLDSEKSTAGSFTLLIAGLASISLLVGGIGILAVMLLAIKERTNEIGLRMAVGARPKDVLVQFLSEAAMLGFAGGLSGLALGIATARGVSWWTGRLTVISVESLVLSLLFSLSVGLFFGVYPAKKASLMNPIDALRKE